MSDVTYRLSLRADLFLSSGLDRSTHLLDVLPMIVSTLLLLAVWVLAVVDNIISTFSIIAGQDFSPKFRATTKPSDLFRGHVRPTGSSMEVQDESD
jgi:hypothetical protein